MMIYYFTESLYIDWLWKQSCTTNWNRWN